MLQAIVMPDFKPLARGKIQRVAERRQPVVGAHIEYPTDKFVYDGLILTGYF